MKKKVSNSIHLIMLSTRISLIIGSILSVFLGLLVFFNLEAPVNYLFAFGTSVAIIILIIILYSTFSFPLKNGPDDSSDFFNNFLFFFLCLFNFIPFWNFIVLIIIVILVKEQYEDKQKDKIITNDLKALINEKNSICIEDLSRTLNISRSIILTKILKIAKKYSLKIDGDYILMSVDLGNSIDKLMKEFDNWK